MKTPSDRPLTPSQGIGLAPVQLWLSALSALLWAGLCAFAALVSPSAQAQTLADTTVLRAEVEGWLKAQTASGQGSVMRKNGWRMETEVGQLDPRLKLAPCDKVRVYVPEGAQMWGRTRVGLRCEQGAVRWQVFWPITVKVWGQALVAAVPLRPGAMVEMSDLRMAEVDLAERTAPAMIRPDEAVGRSVMRNVEVGQAVRQDDLKARRWFAAGDPVRLTVKGPGFQIAAEGTALSHGDEGQCARIRTDNGRVVCGHPVGDRQVELSL